MLEGAGQRIRMAAAGVVFVALIVLGAFRDLSEQLRKEALEQRAIMRPRAAYLHESG